MSFLPNAGLVAGGASLALSGGSAYCAANAFKNAVQGNSTEGQSATYFQRGVTAVLGNTSDTTTQLVRHVAEGTVFAGVSLASAATAAATFDTEGSYTLGLGNFGFDLSQITLFSAAEEVADVAEEVVAEKGNWDRVMEFAGDNWKMVGGTIVGLAAAYFLVPALVRRMTTKHY